MCVCQRLAEGCVSDPALKENSFTSPSKHSDAHDSLESLCQRLLHSCDAVWIPTVMVRADVFLYIHKQGPLYIYFLSLETNTSETLQNIQPYVSSL